MTFDFSRYAKVAISIPIVDDDLGHTLNGTGYTDFIVAMGGNDIIHLKGGIGDTAMGGTGNDKIYGEGGTDNIHGDADNDTIYGGAGNDFLWGDDGNDYVSGGDGKDEIHFGSGRDKARGDGGADKFVFDATNINGGLGIDTIYDFKAKGAGQDHISLREWGFKWANRDKGMEDGLEIIKTGTDVTIHVSQALLGTGTIILKNVAFADINLADFIV